MAELAVRHLCATPAQPPRNLYCATSTLPTGGKARSRAAPLVRSGLGARITRSNETDDRLGAMIELNVTVQGSSLGGHGAGNADRFLQPSAEKFDFDFNRS